MMCAHAERGPCPPSPTIVGNDVVDLKDAEARGKATDQRYISRVLTRSELDACAGVMSDSLLWQIWSAKESAYKVIDKAFGKSPTPRSMEVEPNRPWKQAPTTGTVHWSGHQIPVLWDIDTDRVHCMAWRSEGSTKAKPSELSFRVEAGARSWLREASLTPREALTAKNAGSAAVRALAREMVDGADRACQTASRTEILRAVDSRGYGAPSLWRDDGRMDGYDLSLSHHGRYVAVALWKQPDLQNGSVMERSR